MPASQLDHLAHQATKNLVDASPKDRRQVYDLLDLHIDVTPERTYQISGTIPTHGPLTSETFGEVSAGVPRDPLENLTRVEFSLQLSAPARPR